MRTKRRYKLCKNVKVHRLSCCGAFASQDVQHSCRGGPCHSLELPIVRTACNVRQLCSRPHHTAHPIPVTTQGSHKWLGKDLVKLCGVQGTGVLPCSFKWMDDRVGVAEDFCYISLSFPRKVLFTAADHLDLKDSQLT